MANYQIKLTPIDTFFFGGEKHIEKNGKIETNYFVESNLYPQQTTLLGLLRYYLLLKNNIVFDGKKITDKIEAARIIGDSSFDYNTPPQDYGKIKSISPLYFHGDNQCFFYAPLDVDFKMTNFQLSKMKDGNDTNYNAKDFYYDICQQVISDKGDKKKLSVIIEDAMQVGNEKAAKGESKEDKFYKQNSKRMKSGWCFCFDAEIADNAGIPQNDALFIPFGGEKSFFKMEVDKKDPVAFTPPKNFVRNKSYILCISDCFVDPGFLEKSELSVNRYVSFRNLKSKVKGTEKYSGLSKNDPEQLSRSDRFNLLQRGSILYFDSNEKLEEVAEIIQSKENTHCKTIGFNHIITIKN